MHRRLFFLLAGHIALDVLMLALTFLIARQVYLAAMGLAAAQLSLLGIWIGLARASLRRRLGVAVLAICGATSLMTIAFAAYFQALHPSYRLGLMDAFLFWPPFAISNTGKFAGAAAAVLFLPLWRVQLHQARDLGPSPPGSGFRFSILHVMLLTLVVGLFLAVGQHIRGFFGTGLQGEFSSSFYLLLQFTGAPAGVAQAAALALLAMWASLAADRPHWRVAAALALSLVVGLAAPFLLASSRGEFIFSILYATVHTAIVVASLLVVRSCGYRLAVKRVAAPVPSVSTG
ncbi:MAG: hypothetical protein WD278_03950 [Pirellulales bacterium]